MRFFTAGVLLATLWAPAAGAADPVGADACASCHPDAYLSWQASKHARALTALSPAEQKEPRCLVCHAPSEDVRLSGVGCETCHGPGQYYGPDYVMKDAELARLVGLVDPSEKACRNCHDAASPSLRPFDFAQALKRIDHWTIERERKKRQGKTP